MNTTALFSKTKTCFDFVVGFRGVLPASKAKATTVVLCLVQLLWLFPARSRSGEWDHFYFTNTLEMLHAPARSNHIRFFDVSAPKASRRLCPVNEFTNIMHEVRGDVFKRLVSTPAGLGDGQNNRPLFSVVACEDMMSFRISFGVGGADTNAQIYEPFHKRAKFYVTSRFQGHSSNYVVAALNSVSQSTNQWPATLPRFLRDKYWVPKDWVEKHDSAWVVVEGCLAWTYREDHLGSGYEEVRDAQEYDPKLKPQFEQARVQLKSKIRGNSIDSTWINDQLLKSILKDQFGINWTPPSEIGLGP
jgi:hypothetical protein